MSATAVFANPSRRNSASAVSTIRARVSSGLVLTCGLIGDVTRLNNDNLRNSSLVQCQVDRFAGPSRFGVSRSTLGHRQRRGFCGHNLRSVFEANLNFRYWHLADIDADPEHVRYWG